MWLLCMHRLNGKVRAEPFTNQTCYWSSVLYMQKNVLVQAQKEKKKPHTCSIKISDTLIFSYTQSDAGRESSKMCVAQRMLLPSACRHGEGLKFNQSHSGRNLK